MSLACYISGHGFGHASRQIAILNALASRAPNLDVLLRTTVPRWLLERTLSGRFSIVESPPVDTGIVQLDSLHLDAQATVECAREFYERFDERVDAEAALLRERGIRLVVADAPPLGCAAAAAAGLPSVVISNFTWDWIYEEYREELGAVPSLIPTIKRAYAQADAAWRLPMYGGFESFKHIIDMPFVARHARHDRDETRERFGLPANRRVALSSFGGYGVDRLDFHRLDCLGDWTILVTGTSDASFPAGVRVIEDDEIYARGFRYEDLVRASDVVVTKPGYGIVSECVANGPAIVYTPRGRFAEYDVLVSEIRRLLRSAFLSHEDLFAGRWLGALNEAQDAHAPADRPPTDGAEVIADRIVALCSHAETSSGHRPRP